MGWDEVCPFIYRHATMVSGRGILKACKLFLTGTGSRVNEIYSEV